MPIRITTIARPRPALAMPCQRPRCRSPCTNTLTEHHGTVSAPTTGDQNAHCLDWLVPADARQSTSTTPYTKEDSIMSAPATRRCAPPAAGLPGSTSAACETPTSRAIRHILADLAQIGAQPTDRAVYLIHLAQPYPGGNRPQHYLGSARRLLQRLLQHWTGDRQGSPLLRAATRANIKLHLVRTWPGGPGLERQLKRRRRHRVYCPYCQPAPE